MEPDFKKRPVRPSGLIIGTALFLLGIFVMVILAFFAVSAVAPAFTGKCVAVVNIDSEITTQSSAASLFSPGIAGSETIANAVDALDKREDVGAVLFVFNSPGGSVVATREIYNSVKALNKPKVSYFREMAASGAYYISTGTNYIVADPDTITGSIGVITTITSMEGLFDKLGIDTTAITSGAYKDMGSPYRNMSPGELALFKSMIDDVYQDFKLTVIKNRGSHLDSIKFEEIADGRVLSGRQAYKVGLVDQLGSKKDAIMKAASLAAIEANSIDDVRLCEVQTLPIPSSLFSLEGIVHIIKAQSSLPKLSFK